MKGDMNSLPYYAIIVLNLLFSVSTRPPIKMINPV